MTQVNQPESIQTDSSSRLELALPADQIQASVVEPTIQSEQTPPSPEFTLDDYQQTVADVDTCSRRLFQALRDVKPTRKYYWSLVPEAERAGQSLRGTDIKEVHHDYLYHKQGALADKHLLARDHQQELQRRLEDGQVPPYEYDDVYNQLAQLEAYLDAVDSITRVNTPDCFETARDDAYLSYCQASALISKAKRELFSAKLRLRQIEAYLGIDPQAEDSDSVEVEAASHSIDCQASALVLRALLAAKA